MKGQLLCIAVAIVLICPFASAQWLQADWPYGDNVVSLTISGANVYAGTAASGVYRSIDGGTTWTAANAGLTSGYVSALAFSGANLFAGTWKGGVFLSTNNGQQWTAVGTDVMNPSIVYAFAVSGTGIFAGTDNGVFLSADSGRTWTSVNTGLTSRYCLSLLFSGTSLFVGSFGGVVFRSTNNGASWTEADSGLKNLNPRPGDLPWVEYLALSGTNLFAGTWGGGVFLSTNDGASWASIIPGLSYKYIDNLAVSGSNIFASIYQDDIVDFPLHSEVFLSTDNGSIWTSVDTGLGYIRVYSLAVSGTSLYAGTEGSGVWRRPLSEMVTGVEMSSTEVPRKFKLEQNYPNPFNPSTTIRYALPQRSQVALTVFNTLSQAVATLVQEEQNAGYHEVRFDGSNLASGVYFYRLMAGDYVATKKLVVLR